MLGVDEVYNQHRLNEINSTNLKVVTTHVGIDVGEDGKTHMCIDYIGLLRNIFGFNIICPADPNEVDVVIRHVAKESGNFHVAMGRSKVPVITKEDGSIFFDENYEFKYGEVSTVRQGKDNVILAYGATLYRACAVHDILKAEGIECAVINVPTPAYLSDNAFENISAYKNIFIYEDHILSTGLFSTLANLSLRKKQMLNIIPYAIEEFPVSGSADEVYDMLGLSPAKVAEKILKELGR